jgi:hypothetical protein
MLRRTGFLVIGTWVICTATSLANSQEWTDTNSLGDWGGRDRTCSQGSVPDPDQCRSEYRGQVAVCWSNRRTGECGGATAWCTYKTVGLTTPQNGGAPGHIYYCGALGMPTTRVSVCHGEHQKKVINFNPLKDQDEHGCDDHSGWSVFEGCSGGGPNPSASGQAYCGGQLFTVELNYPSVSGNKCGYAWFTVTCWSGR